MITGREREERRNRGRDEEKRMEKEADRGKDERGGREKENFDF